jgi:hypothetical protein
MELPMRSKGWQGLFLGLAAAVLFSVATVTATTTRAEEPLPDCQVLAVGVNLYSPESRLPNLKGCKNDAVNLSQRLTDQEGKLFAKVAPQVLADEQATGNNTRQAMERIRKQGKAGDWIVLVLSGHADIDSNGALPGRWYFLLHDGGKLSAAELLEWTDALAAEGKKVWIIVDACHAGQLRLNAQELLERYQDPRGGGILLMLASMPRQQGLCLGQFGSYAQAVNEALAGDGDLNGDGVVTLREVRHYAYHRTYELVRQFIPEPGSEHDGECSSSLSIADSLPLAMARGKVIFKANAELTRLDAKDTTRENRFLKVYTVKLQEGATYTIDLKSGAFDTLLRLEDAEGRMLAENDDVRGRDCNSRLVFTPASTAEYRIAVTTFGEGETGSFTLKVKQNS